MSDWKLVPVEPTQAMFDMFADASDESGDDFVIAYAAMLEAAPQPDTVEPITKRQLDAIWEHGFDAESSDEQEYCGSLIRARNSLDEIAKPDTVAVDRESMGRLIYEAMYAHQGGRWEANDSKEVWYGTADRLRALLDQEK